MITILYKHPDMEDSSKGKATVSADRARIVAAILATYVLLEFSKENVNFRSSLRVFHNRLLLNDRTFVP